MWPWPSLFFCQPCAEAVRRETLLHLSSCSNYASLPRESRAPPSGPPRNCCSCFLLTVEPPFLIWSPCYPSPLHHDKMIPGRDRLFPGKDLAPSRLSYLSSHPLKVTASPVSLKLLIVELHCYCSWTAFFFLHPQSEICWKKGMGNASHFCTVLCTAWVGSQQTAGFFKSHHKAANSLPHGLHLILNSQLKTRGILKTLQSEQDFHAACKRFCCDIAGEIVHLLFGVEGVQSQSQIIHISDWSICLACFWNILGAKIKGSCSLCPCSWEVDH